MEFFYADQATFLHVSPSNETSRFFYTTFVASSLGVFFCVSAFILLVVTYLLFPEWRKNRKNKLLIQFMLARIFYTITRYVYDARNIFFDCRYNCIIYLDAISLIYTECALVAWMFVFSKNLNDSLVKVFDANGASIKKISLYTWLVPGVVSSLLYVAFSFQTNKEITFFLLYMFFIKWPVLWANAILLITALKAVIVSNKSSAESNFKIVIVMILLVFGFSFQQLIMDTYKIINIFVENVYAHYYLIMVNIFSIYHCASSILFWLFGNAETRKMWKSRKPKTPKVREDSVESSSSAN